MFQFTLVVPVGRPVLCPACLEVLSDANLVFMANVAFCPDCVRPFADRSAHDCVHVLAHLLHRRHVTTYRRLSFFTPSNRPVRPLQLLPETDRDRFYIRSDVPFQEPLIVDGNPIAGGSPV